MVIASHQHISPQLFAQYITDKHYIGESMIKTFLIRVYIHEGGCSLIFFFFFFFFWGGEGVLFAFKCLLISCFANIFRIISELIINKCWWQWVSI